MRQHLNYCRQMRLQFAEALAGDGVALGNREVLSHAIDLSAASQKFILPAGGRLYDDYQFRALDETEKLALPFDLLALEYHPIYSEQVRKGVADKTNLSTKRIVFARQREDWIVITVILWMDLYSCWGPLPEIAIPRTNYLDRSTIIDGRVAIRINQQSIEVSVGDYADEVGALLCLLNALQCANVHMEKSFPKNIGKKVKSALQFDSYHILTVDTSPRDHFGGLTKNSGHRSPREHLRRGHIRRYESGLKIWVQPTVVNAGVGGKISKDYFLAAA